MSSPSLSPGGRAVNTGNGFFRITDPMKSVTLDEEKSLCRRLKGFEQSMRLPEETKSTRRPRRFFARGERPRWLLQGDQTVFEAQGAFFNKQTVLRSVDVQGGAVLTDYMLTRLHAFMITCLHAYMLTCFPTCIFGRWHDSCLHACIHTCVHAYLHLRTCLHAYMVTCLHALPASVGGEPPASG